LSPDGSRLVYSTYIGGNDYDLFPMIAIDRSGNTYIEGATFSTDFPTTPGSFQPACASCANGVADTYVTKLNPDGTALVYSTYLGGSDFEICGSQIAVDSVGSVYVNGFTCSTDFPTHNPLLAVPAGGCDGFLTKLNPAGSGLVYSTYLGGSDFETILGTAIDSAGNAYISGLTFSSDFPTTPGAFQTNFVGGSNCPFPPCADAFVAKINPSGTGLVYSTYLGGTGDEFSPGVVVDSDGSAYVGGITTSTDFPTLNPFQPANAGGYDIFVTELNAAGSALVYSTYLGGSSDEFMSGMAIDSRRNVYLEGITASSDFLAVNPAQPQFGGGTFDALLAKISPIDAPGLGLSRLSVDFPGEPPGTTSPPQTVTVHSVGSQSLVISEILTAPDQFAQTNTCTQALAPGETCTISITYTAKQGGVGQGVLAVVANSTPASGQVRLVVTDQPGSASVQKPVPSRLGNAITGGNVLQRRNAILRKKAVP
jgi:beta-propeller repeat-containing protein